MTTLAVLHSMSLVSITKYAYLTYPEILVITNGNEINSFFKSLMYSSKKISIITNYYKESSINQRCIAQMLNIFP